MSYTSKFVVYVNQVDGIRVGSLTLGKVYRVLRETTDYYTIENNNGYISSWLKQRFIETTKEFDDEELYV